MTWHTYRIHTGWRLEYMKVVNTSLEYIQVEDLTQVKNTNNLLSWHKFGIHTSCCLDTSLGYIQVEGVTQVKNTYKLLSWHNVGIQISCCLDTSLHTWDISSLPIAHLDSIL